MGLYREIYDLTAANHEYMVNIRRMLHQNPELSMEEYETAALIRRELDQMGIAWKAVGETGTLGTIPATAPGGCTVALRADIDALPVQEETGLPFSSRVDGKMHACGHDGHTAMLLGAAKTLMTLKERPNTVKLLFQPAEETGKGAGVMIEGGALDGVDAIYGSHLWPEIPLGKVGLRDGAVMAGADKYVIKVTGKGGHGSEPQNCNDPIPACTSIVDGIHQIKSLSLRGDTPMVLTVGYIKCGTVMNVIPDSGEICGTIRWYDRKTQETAHDRLKKVADGSALMYDCKAETNIMDICPCTCNNVEQAETAREILADMCGTEAVSTDFKLATGSEDFSFYCEKVPAVFGLVGCCGEGDHYSIHSPYYTWDEKALAMGSALYAAFACGCKKI